MNAKRRHIDADEPLWLVVQQADCSKCFEFSPGNRRALIVGSAETADIRVNDAVPIACFLERDDSSLWLIPADPNAELRLDTVKITENSRIYSHGLLELAGVELRLKVRDTPPTLRGDGSLRFDSEICSPRFNRGKSSVDELATTGSIASSVLQAALRQETMATRTFERKLPGSAFSTDTIEMGPIDFDGWFDAAIQPATKPVERAEESEWDAAPTTPIVACETDVGDPSVSQDVERLDFKTQELAPLSPPECQTSEVSPDADAPCNTTNVVPEATSRVQETPVVPVRAHAKIGNQPTPAPRIDPYQTIEITRARFVEPSTSAVRRLEGSEQSPAGTATECATASVTNDTTEFEVPIGKQPANGSADGSGVDRGVGAGKVSSVSALNTKSDGPSKSRPGSAVTVAHRPLPLTPAEFERAARVAEEQHRRRSVLAMTLAKLGALTKQRPVLVLGGASIGSLVLVMFLLGTAHLIGLRTNQHTNQAKHAEVSPTASVLHTPPRLHSATPLGQGEGASGQVLAAPSAAEAAGTDAPMSNPVPDAIAAPPDVAVAVGHLFAGRLPEAEQAYRDLSSRYPNDPAFRAATRMLARRNSPACRPGVATTISCPTVKP